MRKWFAIAAMGAMFALPAWAQQKNGDDNARDTKAANATAAPATAGGGAGLSHSMRSPFGTPEAPRPKPSPKAGGSSSDDAPARLVPKVEVGGMYDYMNFRPGDPFNHFGAQGGSGSLTYNASKWLGLTAEVGGLHYDRNVFPLTGNNTSVSGGLTTYLFGPRLNLRRFDHFVPFGEFLLGGAHGGPQLIGGAHGQSAFSLAAGGGVDVVITKYLAWRFAQLDYVMTNFSGTGVGGNARQDNFRIGSGIILRFGLPKPPPPPVNHPPVASCSASPTSVYAGSGDAVAVHVDASDPDNDPLTYTYTVTGGTVQGTGPDARWSSAGLSAGTYTVNVKVDDGRGGIASCAADIRVEEKPHHPPTISCATDRSPILQGERATITSTANSPDGDSLTYSYAPSGGQIVGSGPQVQFDSTGLQPGSYSVKCSVADTHGATADASTSVEVKEPPQIKQLEAKLALHSIYFPTAQPTVAKPTGGLLASQAATLDTLASDFKQYLTYRPAAHLTLEGHADVRGAKEYNMKLSERRVERARSYLIEKGVPADRLETKAFGFEKNMTGDEVKKLLDEDSDLSPAERQKLIKNLLTVRLANNRRVDVTLSTTGEQSIRRFPFSAKDALTLLSRGGGEQGKGKAPAAKPGAPKKPTNP